jgi:NCAIR mutase (PurE)-related protein
VGSLRRKTIDELRLNKLLEDVRAGSLTTDDALKALADLPYEDLGFAKPDHHRSLRTGFPEVILGQGKTPENLIQITNTQLEKSDCVLVTKASLTMFESLKKVVKDANYDSTARAITIDRRKGTPSVPGVVITTAGTSDIPIAREATITASLMGCRAEEVFDIGVAGIHRLFAALPTLQAATVIVAIAGMEGALPSVIAGLVRAPVIGVPTSVGYGSNLGGITPLLSMLNGCAPGVAVVNIDNGFGAGHMAALIALSAAREEAT